MRSLLLSALALSALSASAPTSAQAAVLECEARELLIGQARTGKVAFDLEAKTVRWTEGSSLVAGENLLAEGLVCGDTLASAEVECLAYVTPSLVKYQPTHELSAGCVDKDQNTVAQGRLVFSEITKTGRYQCQSFNTNKTTVVELSRCR